MKIELTGEEMDRISDAWQSSPKKARGYILPYIFREVEKIIAKRLQPVADLGPKWDNDWATSGTNAAAGAIRNCTFELRNALIQRAAERIRHDHAYPMDFDQNHHCAGCDLEEELKHAVVKETKKWRGVNADGENPIKGVPTWLQSQGYTEERARECLEKYYGEGWRLLEQSTLTLAWVSVDVERPSDAR